MKCSCFCLCIHKKENLAGLREQAIDISYVYYLYFDIKRHYTAGLSCIFYKLITIYIHND